ncbi:MAG: hypothetical protein CPSOU_2003 [uncultured Paraburkholderia sp.]|nr:MAG: hypothetical protein CPSOU_2003 [uncultured Paraburkholderia sp.]
MSSLSISVNGGTTQVVQLGTLSAAVNQQITQAVSASAASATAAAASASSASSTVSAALAALLPQNLLEWSYASAFRLVSATRDANEAIVTASHRLAGWRNRNIHDRHRKHRVPGRYRRMARDLRQRKRDAHGHSACRHSRL